MIYGSVCNIIKKNKPGGINYLGKVVEKYMKKYPFSHGRSKIGLFLVIHGNNHTLFILKKKDFLSLGMLRNLFHPQGQKQLVKKSLSIPRDGRDSSSKNTFRKKKKSTSWPWEKCHSLPQEIPRLICFFPTPLSKISMKCCPLTALGMN